MKARQTALALPTLLVACATSVPAPLPPQIGSEPRGEWGERLLVEANAIPGAWIQRDTDGGAPKPERDEARGFGARMGIGNRTQSVGVMAQVYSGDDGFDAVVFGFDSDVRARLDRDWPRWLFLRAGASLGGHTMPSSSEWVMIMAPTSLVETPQLVVHASCCVPCASKNWMFEALAKF